LSPDPPAARAITCLSTYVPEPLSIQSLFSSS
jgi:hypothetical protein